MSKPLRRPSQRLFHFPRGADPRLASAVPDGSVPVAATLIVLLLAAAFLCMQALIGGTRLVFSYPADALLGVAGLFSVLQRQRARPAFAPLCLASAALFFGYVIARALLSPVLYLARADLYSVLGGLVVYLVVATQLTSAKARMALIALVMAAALGHVLVGFVQFRHGDNFMPISFLERFDYGRRASGFYVCPNHLAGLLEVLGLFGLSIVCWSRWPVWAKLLAGYATAVCYLGLGLTASRGGYVSAAFSLFVFTALSLRVLGAAKARIFWRVGGAAILLAVVLGAGAFCLLKRSDYLTARAQTIVDRDNVRVDLGRAALAQWKLAPIAGTGSGTYLYYGRQFRSARVQSDPVYTHNDYLQLLAEYGAIAALAFAFFLIVHLANGWKIYQRLGPRRVALAPQLLSNTLALNLAAISAVAAYLIHSALDFNLHIPANVLLLAFVFGLLANPGLPRRDPVLQTVQSIWLARVGLAVLSLVLVIQSLRLFPAEADAERARVAVRDNQPARATLFALRALARENSNPDLFYYLGRARTISGENSNDSRVRNSFLRAALEAFAQGRALAPRDETFPIEMALVYDELERFSEGEWMFSEAGALDPNSTANQNYYTAHLQRWRLGGAPAETSPP